jgi:hypothetical protein
MRKTMTRRALVVAGAASVAAAAGLPAWNAASDPRSTIRAMVMRHIGSAPVEPGAVDAFVEDFVRHEKRLRRDGFAIGNVCEAFGIDDIVRACVNNAKYLHRVEEQVIDLFVRSSDLLAADRRPTDPIRYIAFWDPYAAACRNPFADLTQEA